MYTMRESIDEVFQYFPDGLFKDKSILCPCDGPASKFVEFFKDKWAELGISRLVCVVFNAHSHGQFMVMTDPQKEEWHDLFGHGDFRDEETLKYWQEADFIITNPPFSLAHDFIKRCYDMDKQFCVVGNIMIPLYNRVFPRMFSGELKVILAKNHMPFTNYAGEHDRIGNGCWLSNMSSLYKPPVYHIKRTKAENEALGYVYKRYDNYDAIEVSHLKYLPSDYEGVMGIPLTFFNWDFSGYKLMGASMNKAVCGMQAEKRYGDIMFHSRVRGRWTKRQGSGRNNDACIEVDERWKGSYFTELNQDKKLRSCFRRVFIQKRKADEQ